MNPGASNVIVQGFLKGGFDVLDALLSLSFMFDTDDISDATDDAINGAVEKYPVILRGKVLGGGAVAFLLSMPDATKIVTLTNTGEATEKDSLDETERGTFKEIVDSLLGGGVSNLSEKFGSDVELTDIEIVVADGDPGAGLMDYLGASIAAAIQFSADPHFNSNAVLLFSQTLEERVPPALVNAVFGEEGGGDAPLVSDEEMNDILSGFSAEGSGMMGGEDAELPPNLGVILDIELTATARLGRIEMPIAEVLSLGPGSIIDVGHHVDEPIELLVNDKLIARGDVVVVDEKFGLRITEIVSPRERIESLG